MSSIDEVREAQIDLLVDSMFVESNVQESEGLQRYEQLLDKANAAEIALAPIMVHDELLSARDRMKLKSISLTLDEAFSASLRAFLFQVPQKQARAFGEIEDRLDRFIQLISKINSKINSKL